MAAGFVDRLWDIEDIIALIDALAPAPKKRGPYKKKGQENSNWPTPTVPDHHWNIGDHKC